MKTLILTDDTYTKLLAALGESDLGSELLGTMAAAPIRLPEGHELVKLARTGGPTPEAIVRACAYREAGRQAADDTRLQVEDLIRRAYKAGVGTTVLSRWFGLARSRVSEVVE